MDVVDQCNLVLRAHAVNVYVRPPHHRLPENGHGAALHDGYLLLATCRDGTLATTATPTTIRVICNCAPTIALNGATSAIKVSIDAKSWLAVVSDVELNRTAGLVTNLLLLDSSQPLAWGAGVNAWLPVAVGENTKRQWIRLDAGTRSMIVVAWSAMTIRVSYKT